jgi:hypothetical protein
MVVWLCQRNGYEKVTVSWFSQVLEDFMKRCEGWQEIGKENWKDKKPETF